ncbi:MAG: DegT/DnrJ/EryC1/StrS family aminotransferase [Cyanobacteria bacterium P01_D01_bin.73]
MTQPPIPAFNLTRQFADTLQTEVTAAVSEVLASGGYVGGPVVAAFETDFAAYHGTTHALGCNSGTDALFLAFRALDIGPGDEVITTPFSFIATAETIVAAGATPVFVDIDPATFNFDLDQVAAAISPRTKAIVPVHLFGQPVDMTRLMAIAQSGSEDIGQKIWVVEDCAQATGSEWNGRKVGNWGAIGCFSFYPTKNLGGCGDGGAMTFNEAAWESELKMYREHGMRRRYYHDEIGLNSRLDAVQATVLKIKLRYLDQWNQARTAIANRYQQLLGGTSGIQLPQATPGSTPVWNQYSIRVGEGRSPELRDKLRAALQEDGIGSGLYYPLPLHLQPVFSNLGYQPGSLPQVERVSNQVMSLPMFPELERAEQERVAERLKHDWAALVVPQLQLT